MQQGCPKYIYYTICFADITRRIVAAAENGNFFIKENTAFVEQRDIGKSVCAEVDSCHFTGLEVKKVVKMISFKRQKIT